MKKTLLLMIICLLAIVANAQSVENTPMVKVYCTITCSEYNLLKNDVNVKVDFGIAPNAVGAWGWIYNRQTNKKMSFASTMSVLNFMAKRGWKYKDMVKDMEQGADGKVFPQDYYLLEKELPADYSPLDVVGDIYYRVE